MFTSAIKEREGACGTRHRELHERYFGKTIRVYLGIAIFCVIFTWIYERFSYGESALCMRLMFLVPLIGGALTFFLIGRLPVGRIVSRIAYNLWNSGLAVIGSGCLIKGIIEISGRSTQYDHIYWICGELLLILSVIAMIARQLKKKV
ncbi:MAG: hypothetical protein Q4C25_08090 [Bacillota bacterium]|nr:hypothetical protein [Bacillota bacterium]